MDIENAMLDLLARRVPGKSICPSEVARALSDDWRPLMPVVRATAARMVAEGRLRITQKGLDIEPEMARGPIRLSLPDSTPT
ncbi:MAG: DUF3253 domain-containing protein [Pseudomonadota bacterium]